MVVQGIDHHHNQEVMSVVVGCNLGYHIRTHTHAHTHTCTHARTDEITTLDTKCEWPRRDLRAKPYSSWVPSTCHTSMVLSRDDETTMVASSLVVAMAVTQSAWPRRVPRRVNCSEAIFAYRVVSVVCYRRLSEDRQSVALPSLTT